MSIESLYPYAGSHAVQNAIFAVEWAEPLKTDAMAALNKLATKFRNVGLSHVQHQQVLEIKLDQPAPGAAVPSQGQSQVLGAVVFAKPAAVGEISRSVTISRQGCMIAIPDYTRWADVSKDVEAYFKIALDEIAPSRALTVIGLQYNDVFNWKDNPADLNLREVFSDRAFIPPNVFEQSGLWHLHHGYMANESVPVSHSRLDNINVDMIEPSGERVIQIIGAHRATLASPLWQSHLKNKQLMLDIFASLHMANKTMLEKLLTKEVCEKIRLTAK